MSLTYDVDCSTIVALYEPNGTLRGPMVGDSTPYHWDGGIEGLGVPDVRNNDVELGHADGSVGQNDFYRPRIITLPLLIGDGGTDKAQSIAEWRALEAGWFKSMYDLTLSVTEPGPDHSFYYGRPNGITRDMTMFQNDETNLIRARIVIRCPNPLRYQGS